MKCGHRAPNEYGPITVGHIGSATYTEHLCEVELPVELRGPVEIDLSKFTAQGYWFKGEYYPMKKESE
jgi:hypothetical protein